jgi:DNA-binding MarR family transcriptional regulator
VTAPDVNSSDSVADAAWPIARACQMVVAGRRAARALADWARRFELSESEFLVLWCVADAAAEGVDQITIAQLLALSPAQVSATVERLRVVGYIVQQAVPGDRRRHLWRLSEAGRNRSTAMLRDARVRTEREAAA